MGSIPASAGGRFVFALPSARRWAFGNDAGWAQGVLVFAQNPHDPCGCPDSYVVVRRREIDEACARWPALVGAQNKAPSVRARTGPAAPSSSSQSPSSSPKAAACAAKHRRNGVCVLAAIHISLKKPQRLHTLRRPRCCLPWAAQHRTIALAWLLVPFLAASSCFSSAAIRSAFAFLACD